MTDIVERLRKMDSISGCSNLFARDAADEIERLRAEVDRIRAGGCARDQRTTQWCAEAEALRRNGDGMVKEVRRLLDRAENAEAENAKLREALREVMRCQEGIAHAHAKPGWEKSIATAWKQALAALEPKEGE